MAPYRHASQPHAGPRRRLLFRATAQGGARVLRQRGGQVGDDGGWAGPAAQHNRCTRGRRLPASPDTPCLQPGGQLGRHRWHIFMALCHVAPEVALQPECDAMPPLPSQRMPSSQASTPVLLSRSGPTHSEPQNTLTPATFRGAAFFWWALRHCIAATPLPAGHTTVLMWSPLALPPHMWSSGFRPLYWMSSLPLHRTHGGALTSHAALSQCAVPRPAHCALLAHTAAEPYRCVGVPGQQGKREAASSDLAHEQRAGRRLSRSTSLAVPLQCTAHLLHRIFTPCTNASVYM